MSSHSDSIDGTTDRYELGLRVRTEVLGEDHVRKSMESATDFTRPIQQLVTEYCWGSVWSREGLAPRDRSIANLAMLTVLNRGHELRVHVKAAVRNGVSETEIQETLLQTAIYAGVPAALESFRIAGEVLAELETETDQ